MQALHPTTQISFASDNYSGVHPKILSALSTCNGGHQPAYGYDVYSERLNELIHQAFGVPVACYPVFNGTGANILGLSALLSRCGAVLCTKHAHIANDEGNAPEYVAGIRPVLVPTQDGKLHPEHIAKYMSDSEHNAQIEAVYISQVTELGTCYSLEELKNIGDECKKHGLYFFVDGARLANAIAHLGCTLADIAKTGIDILSFGGTKNGLMIGELLVILNPALDKKIKPLRKIHLQLGSKMRFISAQFIAWLENDLWLDLAKHSNAMASYLHSQLKELEGVVIEQTVESNAVFARLPAHTIAPLQQAFAFYTWNSPNGVRLMTSFDTQKEDVDRLVATLKGLL